MFAPAGKFIIEKTKKGFIFFPKGKLKEFNIYFIAEDGKDKKVKVHDDGSIIKALSKVVNSVDLIREIRLASRAMGFVFKEDKISVKCDPKDVVPNVKKLERLAAEIATKYAGGRNGA